MSGWGTLAAVAGPALLSLALAVWPRRDDNDKGLK